MKKLEKKRGYKFITYNPLKYWSGQRDLNPPRFRNFSMIFQMDIKEKSVCAGIKCKSHVK